MAMNREDLDRMACGPVLLEFEFDGDGIGAPGRIILQKLDHASGSDYGVHWQNRQTGGCMDGGYHGRLSDALEDMAKRVRREEEFARRRAEGESS